MRILVLISFLLSVHLVGCSSENTEAVKKAKRDTIAMLQDSLRAHVKPDSLRRYAAKITNHLKAYIQKYPKDTIKPEYMYTLANYHFNYLKNPKKALDGLKQLRKEHPDHEKAPFALFTQGFMYQKLDQQDLAREKYETFLEKYPDHELTQDVKLSLEGLGMSTKEQLEQAEKMREERAENLTDTSAGKPE